MPGRHDDAVRVGVRILVAAAIAGLVVLLLHGRAGAAEMASDAIFETLLAAPGVPPAERLEEAQSRLQADRRGRWEAALRSVLQTAWSASQGNPIRAALRGARGLRRTWEDFHVRSQVEREVLGVLDAELDGEVKDPSLLALHRKLLDRERSVRLRGRIEDVRDALNSGELERARLRLGHLVARGNDEELESLRVSLLEEQRRRAERRSALLDSSEQSRAWEPQVLSALLVGDVRGVCEYPSAAGETDLLCAAALHSAGRREEAIDLLGSVAEGSGPEALAAARWLSAKRIHPHRHLDRAVRGYRVRRILGWLGGSELERRGLSLSSKAARAWKAVLSPANLVLAMPMRILRGRKPEGSEVRRAAELILDWNPKGSAAVEARDWLARTEPTPAERRRDALFEDAMLRLPKARTRYTPVFARPVLLTGSLARSDVGPALRRVAERYPDAKALLLVPESPLDDAVVGLEPPLTAPEAVTLLHELARALERGDAEPFAGSDRGHLDALRRLELGIRAGRLLQVRTLSSRMNEISSATEDFAAFLEGGTATVAGVAVSHKRDDLRVERTFVSRVHCPEGIVCLDRPRPIGGGVYARVGVDGKTRIGIETRFHHASLRLEMSETGPSASLHLPVAAMLGIDRWVPVGASLGASLTGLSLDPTINNNSY